MKALYSHIRELVPGLKANVHEVANALTLTGIMVEKIEEFSFKGKNDFLLSLEVRQNRPDCLGTIGVAREVAAYFGLKTVLPPIVLPVTKRKLQVGVTAKQDVKRVTVVQIENVQNGESPAWLKEFLETYGMNSVDLLVDLSNYGMIYTGYPNHIFDARKVSGGLTWERAQKNTQLETLDGTILELKKGEHLVVSDRLTPLVLASAVGGKRSAISKNTNSILLEVAVYDGAKLLKDARNLGVVTEAGNRLQKHLATEPALYALKFIANLFVTYAKGSIATQVFDYYPKPGKTKPIKLSAELPSVYSGIAISEKEIADTLKHLGFTVKLKNHEFLVTPPDFRTDIELDVDVIEEVIRMVGYDTIPIEEPPALAPVANVTAKSTLLANKLSWLLSTQGLDEVRTLPLTTIEANTSTNYREWTNVIAQNSINEEFPALRNSLVSGLLEQQKSYLKKNIGHIGIFELGKVFGLNAKKRTEELEVLAGLLQSPHSLQLLQQKLEQSLLMLGFGNITLQKRDEKIPEIANPYSCFTIFIGEIAVGLMYSFKPLKLTGNSLIPDSSAFELDISILARTTSEFSGQSAEELQEKLIVLDANIELEDTLSVRPFIQEVTKKLRKHIWSIEVVDSFQLEHKIRYTFRVSYKGLADADAKELHEKNFV